MTLRRFRALAFIAAAAALMHLAWPFAGMLQAAPQGELVLCTAHGAMTVPAPADEAPKQKPPCGLCAAGVALLGAEPRVVAAAGATVRIHSFESIPALPRANYSSARPRAPPAFS